MSKTTIFSAQTTDGNSASFNAIGGLNGSCVIYPFLTIYGDFGGASIDIEYQAEDGNWYSTGDTAITSHAAYFIEISINCAYRLALTNASGSTSISSTVYNIA